MGRPGFKSKRSGSRVHALSKILHCFPHRFCVSGNFYFEFPVFWGAAKPVSVRVLSPGPFTSSTGSRCGLVCSSNPPWSIPGLQRGHWNPETRWEKRPFPKPGSSSVLGVAFIFSTPKTESNSCRVISESAKQGFRLPLILSVPNMWTSRLLKLLLSQFNLKNRKSAKWCGGARVGRGKLNFYSQSLIHLEKESHTPSDWDLCQLHWAVPSLHAPRNY